MSLKEKIKNDKILLASLLISVVSFMLVILGFALLPDKIFVSLFSESSRPETDKTFFLVASFATIVLSAVMSFVSALFFDSKTRKWLALEAVLAIAFIGCVVYNCIVL